MKTSWRHSWEMFGMKLSESADSMILNLLLSSKLPVVATADGDIQYIAKSLREHGKFVLDV